MREFERIKAERELEKKLEKEEKAKLAYEENKEEILSGNPLHKKKGSYSLKKKWYEETVFRN